MIVSQVVNVLLVVTLAGGVFQVLDSLLNNPASVVELLATSIPSVSTFFMTFLLLNGLVGSSVLLLQPGPLIIKWLKRKFLGSTPRSMLAAKQMTDINYGTVVPAHTLAFCISRRHSQGSSRLTRGVALIYAVQAPLILLSAVVYFGLHYVALRYQFLYVYYRSYESSGLHFQKAVQHVFTGLYLMAITLLGLFFSKGATACGIVMLVHVVLLAAVHAYLTRGYPPQMRYIDEGDPWDTDQQALDQMRGGPWHSTRVAPEVQENVTRVPQPPSGGTESGATDARIEVRGPEAGRGPTTARDVGDVVVRVGDPPRNYASQLTRDRPYVRHFALHRVPVTADQVWLHPALIEPIPTVWLPQLPTHPGLVHAELAALATRGIPATADGAMMDSVTGRIRVWVGMPPFGAAP